MIYVAKSGNEYYIRFSGDHFHECIQTAREHYLFYNSRIQGYVGSKYKIANALEYLKIYDTITYAPNIEKELQERDFKYKETIFQRVKFNESLVKKPPIGQYQIDDAKQMMQQNRFLNANDVGIGKTYETIVALNHLFHYGRIDKILIISVPESIYGWKHELMEFSFFKEDEIEVVTTENKEVESFFDKKVLIMSYRTYMAVSDFYYKKKTKKSGKDYRICPIELNRFGKNRCLILDESHSIKNIKSRSFKLVKNSKKYFEYIYCLTATPHPNHYGEIYANLNILDSGLVGNEQEDFYSYLGKLGDGYSDFNLDAKNINEHRVNEHIDLIKDIYVKRYKKDVLPDMPDQYIKKVYVEMSKKHKEVYNDIVLDKLKKIVDENGYLYTRNVCSTFPYLTLACSDPSIIKNVELQSLKKWKSEYNNKFEMVDSLLEKHKGEKILLWSNHPSTIDILMNRYDKHNPYRIDGTTNEKGIDKAELKHIIKEDFRKSKDRNLAIFSPLCMGASISIPESSVAICFDRDYDNVKWLQLLGRNYRITSKKDVSVYVLLFEESLEIYQDFILDKKMNMNDILAKETLSDEEWRNIFNMKSYAA